MGWTLSRATFSALILAASFLPAAAQRPVTRQIVPVPYNDNTPVSVSVAMDAHEPRIGSTVAICFESSRAGYATLWDISTQGEVSRIFPNSFLPGVSATRVEGAHRYCAGVSGDPFRFRVDGPPGTEDLYLFWTARPELQPPTAQYADAGALVASLQKVAGAGSSDWATSKLTYDIVPAGGPVAPPLPPQQVTGATTPDTPPAQAPTASPTPAARPKIFILAMGANVDQLTKTNQDASTFTRAVTKLFDVPADNTRLLVNGTHDDFFHGMQWLADRAGPHDFIFIYFSGHGGRFESKSSNDGWDEYLVPYDFNTPGADVKNLIFSQQLARWINELPTKNIVAVMDACHSAGVFRSLEANILGARGKFMSLSPEAQAELLAHPPGSTGTRAAGGAGRVKANGVLLAASRRDQNALEGSAGGFFTVALTEEMMAKAGGTLADVFTRSVDDTLQMTHNRQTPEAVGDMETARRIKFNP